MAREFCPHHVSHYLGMDVHDTDDIKRSIKLCPGMVVTVEPGIALLFWIRATQKSLLVVWMLTVT